MLLMLMFLYVDAHVYMSYRNVDAHCPYVAAHVIV